MNDKCVLIILMNNNINMFIIVIKSKSECIM